MIIKDRKEIESIKHILIEELKKEHAFWSYPQDCVSSNLDDDQLIALTLRHLDIPEINMLFSIFPNRKIKDVWRRILVPEGEYLYTLNRFLSWYYFKSKKPDKYLKSLITRHLNSLPA